MKNIDDIFQQRLYDTEVAPPPFVWPSVERELRRRRRRAFFWWFFGAALLATAVGLWQFAARPAVSLSKADGPAQQSLSGLSPAPNGDTPTLTAGITERLATTAETAAEQPAAHQAQPDFHPKQGAMGGGLRPHFLDKKSTANTSRLAKTGAAEAADESVDQQVENAFVRASGGAAALPPSDVRASERAESAAAAGPAADEVPAPSTATVPTPDAPLPTAHSQLLASNLLPTGYSLLPAKLPVAAKPFPHARASTRKKPNKYKNCYDFNSHPNVFLMDVYVGPSLARKDLRPASPEESWYRQRRLATESSDWAFNAGVRGTLLLNQHFLIRSGLHYDQVVEKFEYADPNYREVNIRQRSVLVNGVWQTVSDTSVSYGEHYTKTYNRFGMLDIPLQVGVEVRNRRSGVSLQAGASVNVLFWKRGSILSVTEQPASFAPDGGGVEVFRPRTGLSVSGSVQWFYHLRPRLRVFAEPYFRQVLRPVTLDGHPVEQRYGIGGIRLGLTKIMD